MCRKLGLVVGGGLIELGRNRSTGADVQIV